LIIQRYDPTSTSFTPVVDPVRSSLAKSDATVLIADTLGRTELLVRQLRRAGLPIDRPGAGGRVVGATAEGLDPELLTRASGALDGVFLAPVASPGAADPAFLAEHTAQQGRPPTPEALLVWRALRVALGETAETPVPGLVRVEGGRLVPASRSG
jgi:hypothetical protein